VTPTGNNDIHQVRIQTDFMADGIAILVVLKTGQDRRILRPPHTWEIIDQAAIVEPTLTLSDGHARALMSALLEHYHGTPDSNTLRQDLLHERDRRDKLEDNLISALSLVVTRQLPRPGGQVIYGGGGASSVSSNAPGSQ
jgi:hypothetical protein